MKKSRIAKFALLGASAAALAATLSTSTYAWYVSNKTATVASRAGETDAATSDGSVLLSWTGNDDTWFKDLAWSDDGATTTHFSSSNALQPLHFAGFSNGTYSFTGIKTDVKTTPSADTTHYIQFDLYIKSDAAINVTPTVTVNNTSTESTMAAAQQVAYVANLTPVSVRQKFVIDCMDALYVGMAIDTAAPVWTAASGDRYDNTGKTTQTSTSNGKAHDYYEELTGETIDADYKDPVTTGTWALALTAGTAKHLTFTVFLDGGDEDCYNSCAAQDISVSVKFQA